jgi:cytochrome bd-type quinol oxidase subunit 2
MTVTQEPYERAMRQRTRALAWLRRWAVGLLAVSLLAIGAYVFVTRTGEAPSRAAAAAPGVTLTLLLWVLAGGVLVLFPSLIYLFRIFKRQPEEGPSRHSSRTDESRRIS